MRGPAVSTCPNCERLQERMQKLEELVAAQAEQIRLLQEKLAAAGKNSSTSSKPPSSDIVKPPKPEPPAGQDKRSIGGQPGHPKHERAPFPPEQVNHTFDHTPGCCPDCGAAIHPLPGPPRVVQQMDIRLTPGAPAVSIADFGVEAARLAIYVDGASVHVGHRLRRDRTIRQKMKETSPPWHVVELRAADLARGAVLVEELMHSGRQ